MKLTFTFLINDSINQEKLWYEYFKNAKNYNIIIHCSKSNDIKYLSELTDKIFVNQIESSWSHLLKVENFLLEKSNELDSDKTIILSNSCIPIKPFEYLYKNLQPNKSYIKWENMWKDCPAKLERHPTKYEFLKAQHQWCILDKKHINIFLNNNIRNHFEIYVRFPEESYYSTILSKYGLLNNENVINDITTFVDWSRSTNNNCSPYMFESYNNYDFDLINQMDDKYFFMRKISKNIDEKLLNLIKNKCLCTII